MTVLPSYQAHQTAIIEDNCVIGRGTKIWHFSHIMAGSRIGEQCTIGQNVVISPDVILGNQVKVQNNVSVYSGVVCEDDVFLGPSVVFTNIRNPRSAISRRHEYQPTLVKRGATLGANSTIMCGIQIGEFAFIGAGAIVTKSVLPYALVYGNPARQHGWISEYGHRLQFNKQDIATCPESHERYQLHNNKILKIC
jgi:UDP-2-acetamido-3-amino-2,3-dideoxy-glucuronate N-acetyltransferase